jgi:hypothetical protein
MILQLHEILNILIYKFNNISISFSILLKCTVKTVIITIKLSSEPYVSCKSIAEYLHDMEAKHDIIVEYYELSK